ncbi:MAG: hypothetical protein QG608_3659 [Actinomycetota bacterium]|nr:hypothetical protein [Actinomycetota bacterium]
MRIGITGHANLTENCVPVVREAIRNRLTELGRGSDLVGVSCLAVGADQIFAAVLLDLGGALEAVLPAPDYRDEKVSADNLAEFDDLLRRADSVRYTTHPRSGRHAYLEAGHMLLGSVDRLLAVWDGGPSGGLGGTADVVAQARRTAVPVDIIWPHGAQRG